MQIQSCGGNQAAMNPEYMSFDSINERTHSERKQHASPEKLSIPKHIVVQSERVPEEKEQQNTLFDEIVTSSAKKRLQEHKQTEVNKETLSNDSFEHQEQTHQETKNEIQNLLRMSQMSQKGSQTKSVKSLGVERQNLLTTEILNRNAS